VTVIPPRPSLFFLGVILAGALALVLASGHAVSRQRSDRSGLEALASLAGRLALTDLALFTEARYTRHPSQADFHAPFQDHPAALEHFPSGSFVPPPRGAP
jgi:hypothetical protein